jgi:hypothetical protein
MLDAATLIQAGSAGEGYLFHCQRFQLVTNQTKGSMWWAENDLPLEEAVFRMCHESSGTISRSFYLNGVPAKARERNRSVRLGSTDIRKSTELSDTTKIDKFFPAFHIIVRTVKTNPHPLFGQPG